MRSILLAALPPRPRPSRPRAATLDGIPVDVDQCERAGPVRREGQRHPQLRLAARSGASASRRRIRSISAAVREDRYAPDWTACEDISAATSEIRPPRKVTFYEDVELWLTGYLVRELLARQGRALPGRRPGRARAPSRAALGAPQRARRGGPRALSRPTAIGASARCRRPISAGAPMAPRSCSGPSRRKAGRS